VSTMLTSVLYHLNSATVVYVSIVWVCIIEINIEMDLRAIGLDCMDLIYMAEVRDQWHILQLL
jgi:hypothetical protein